MATLAWKANLSWTQGFTRASPETAAGGKRLGAKPTVLSFECMEDRKLLSITTPLPNPRFSRTAIPWARAACATPSSGLTPIPARPPTPSSFRLARMS